MINNFCVTPVWLRQIDDAFLLPKSAFLSFYGAQSDWNRWTEATGTGSGKIERFSLTGDFDCAATEPRYSSGAGRYPGLLCLSNMPDDHSFV
jgi:hypothetical protein